MTEPITTESLCESTRLASHETLVALREAVMSGKPADAMGYAETVRDLAAALVDFEEANE